LNEERLLFALKSRKRSKKKERTIKSKGGQHESELVIGTKKLQNKSQKLSQHT
jgi:hypothetical protein